jgi:Ser/Thr protein kinase RdoA (MazF antagonist)
MSWPTPQDYNEAIQNPQSCFSDAELRQGTPVLTPLGLPKPISGAFASVYQVDCQGRSWAVRCFLREFADQERRYSAISDRLGAAHLPCMVGFEFLARGILIRGRWYPVLKMEWIDGEQINDYIRRVLNQRQALQSLSRQWIDLMASLRKAQIAHGDLQHGNILVSGGVLKLIDYDA